MRRLLLCVLLSWTIVLAGGPVGAFAQASVDRAPAPKETPKPMAPKPTASPAAPKLNAAAVPTTPERTTASFGDWVLTCETPTNGKRLCEVGQAITVQGQSGPIAQVALARASRTEPTRFVLVLPTNVTVTSPAAIFAEKDEKFPLGLEWQRCVQGACIASAIVGEDVLSKFASRSEPGSIAFKDAGERDVAIPLSFRGLAQAIAARIKE
jgi:invasion protein IalB